MKLASIALVLFVAGLGMTVWMELRPRVGVATMRWEFLGIFSAGALMGVGILTALVAAANNF
jgi:hypothetical protein